VGDLDISAQSNLQKVLLDISAHGKSIDRALPVVAEMLHGAVNDVFEAEGPGWEPLSDATKAARRGTSFKILQDTGLLAGSLEPSYGSTYAEVVDGTTYGHYHVTGTKRMPKRDWTDLGPFEEPLLDEVAEFLTGHF